jgi:hypothetical protein
MDETHILIRLLQINFPQNWEFDSALSKLQNFEPPNPRHLGMPLSVNCPLCVLPESDTEHTHVIIIGMRPYSGLVSCVSLV